MDKKFNDEEIRAVAQSLASGQYVFSAITPVEILKANKKLRGLSVPKPMDRAVYKAIHKLLVPEFEPYLKSVSSYGVLKKQGVKAALIQFKKAVNSGATYFLTADIRSFFNEINRELLYKRIVELLDDDSLNSYILQSLQPRFLFPPKHPELFPNEHMGIPQGCALSPLFADVYLKQFDVEMHESGYLVLRYVDDFVLVGRNKKEIYNGFRRARKILRKMKLNIHPYKSEKCRVAHILEQPSFLGTYIDSDKNLRPQKKKFYFIKKRVGEVLMSSYPQNLNTNVYELKQMLAGWFSAYSACSIEVMKNCKAELREMVTSLARKIESRFKGPDKVSFENQLFSLMDILQ